MNAGTSKEAHLANPACCIKHLRVDRSDVVLKSSEMRLAVASHKFWQAGVAAVNFAHIAVGQELAGACRHTAGACAGMQTQKVILFILGDECTKTH
jgi:hypothetical protein